MLDGITFISSAFASDVVRQKSSRTSNGVPFPDLISYPKSESASVVSLSSDVQQVKANEDPEKKPDQKKQEQEFTEREQVHLRRLAAREQRVRAHEQAHLAAAAGLASGATFVYEVGPDKKRYAVGGEVSIDTSPAANAEQTIRKAQTIRSAALAPSDPSSQDMSVAAYATRMEAAARAEVAKRMEDETIGKEIRSAKPATDPMTRAALGAPRLAKFRDAIDPETLSSFVAMGHLHSSQCGYCMRSVAQYGP